ncbi:angiopoietin-related protein 5-like [Melanotaenia boesemani]|uniref:angiopoietin-related protein 5-like n=1 Tax=Melanotaenia boesemani TaxID=1250792 RepID=UPI001C047960|nr:angiopoietin-related protein 5-like [Melanotaenia boesemani]
MMYLLNSCGLILVLLLSCSEAEIETPHFSQDCTQLKARSPRALSGLHLIKPAGVHTAFMVYCEMRPDGGWTVFQRRSGKAQHFDKDWKEYKNGFGALTNDHWLGLKKVFSLTNDKSKRWTLRVDLWDHEGGSAFAEYSDFSLGNEEMNYKLHVGNYSGNAGDAIRGATAGIDQNGFGFSTIDRDNDGCSPCMFGGISVSQCAALEGGGWWYSRCGSASLNGKWHRFGHHIGQASGLHWFTWKHPASYSFKASRMMIKSM